YHTLIKEDNDPNTKLLNCLVRHFHIDSSFCVKVPQLSDYWIKEVSGQYAKIFDDLQKRYIAMQGQIGPSETQAMMDIPAIALVAKHESQIKFSDIVVDSYADLLINEFNGIDPDHTNGIERANILLLSSWLKKTGRLEKTRKRLESILKKHPYSSPSVHMSPYYASGYPRFDTSMWYIPSYDNTFELIRVELMDEEFLLNYAKQFVS
ncbi:MAG: hypothetical protein K9M75_09915, partial [Phycisphaerae bacterium]|nr:hypothetical protein [Phycisphaerae bacterium]